jgi:ribonuclease J
LHTNSPTINCRIHRGCHEIGGNCIELEFDGKRIVLDIGLPLSAEGDAELPDISGLARHDDSLLAVIISHPHPDHYGLIDQISADVPIYIGGAARRILEVGATFTTLPGLGRGSLHNIADLQPIDLGPFRITPYRIDHSGYDSYCLLVEAGGRRLFYSGDIRGHGRRSDLFDRITDNPLQDIDVLICEGTQLGRETSHDYLDEAAVARGMAEALLSSRGMGLVWCSSQNVDRIATVAEAAKESGRRVILDMYSAAVLRAANDSSLPDPERDGLRVYLPKSQRRQIIEKESFATSDPFKRYRIYPEHLATVAHESVMIFRPSMYEELKAADCMDDAILISSLWSGYVKQEKIVPIMRAAGIGHRHIHTSGHATVNELKRFVAAFPESRVVPIHLEDREGFLQLSPKAELRDDGEWWEV